MEKIIEKRKGIRECVLKKAKLFIDCVNNRLRVNKAVLIGSYARGDFNKWSDIDILIIVDDDLPNNPLDRLDLITDCLYIDPLIQPILITIKEYRRLKKKNNPVVTDATRHGVVLFER